MRSSKSSIPALKGVYKLNPTEMVMKEGSVKARRAVTENVPSFKKIKPVKPKTVKVKKGK